MDHRSFDSPMDFEYQDKRAQIPANSPWLAGTRTLSGNNNFRNPDKQSMAFQGINMNKKLPETPVKNHVASFRDNPLLDFSSGGENPSSPELGDNDDTPEVNQRLKNLNENVTVFRGNNHSPSKSSSRPSSPSKFSVRNSLSNWAAKFSPSHKSIVRKDLVRQTRATSRPPKRKRREVQKGVAIDSNDEYEDDVDSLVTIQAPNFSPRKTSQNTAIPPSVEIGTLSAILKFINDHPNLPNTLLKWAQMLINVIFMAAIAYVLVGFYNAIQHEITLKAKELGRGVQQAIAICTDHFADHRCSEREKLGSKFRSQCDQWADCMAQDPEKAGRAKITMTIWAEILNSFVETLNPRIIILGVTLFTISVAVPNLWLGSLRRRDAFHPVPAATSAHGNGSNGEQFQPYQEQFYTPIHNRNYDPFSGSALASGRRSPSKELRGVENGSPVRRIQYR